MGPSVHGALVMCMPVKLAWDVISLPENETSCWVYMALCIPGPWLHPTFFREPGVWSPSLWWWNKHAQSHLGESPVEMKRGYSKLKMNAPPRSSLSRPLTEKKTPGHHQSLMQNPSGGWTYTVEQMRVHTHMSLFPFITFYFFPSGENINKPKTHTRTNVNVFSLD